MRKLTRLDPPDCLQQNGERWTAQYLNRIRENPKAKFDWPKGSSAPIRERLAEMTQLHCAFCDDGLLTSSPNTVEHFRPKHAKAFPELAFVWHNLFPCCCQCQQHKREQFDERLLNPDAEGYEFHRYFLADYRSGAINPSPRASAEDQERARITCELYGLNTQERKIARRREFEKWEECRHNERFTLDDFNFRFFLE